MRRADRAARNILDAVEQARAALGRPLRIEITASHLFSVAETDIERFRALDVHANFTPHWFRRRRAMRIRRRTRFEGIAADILTGYPGERESP